MNSLRAVHEGSRLYYDLAVLHAINQVLEDLFWTDHLPR